MARDARELAATLGLTPTDAVEMRGVRQAEPFHG
jgi:hypothetical protein